MYPLEFSGQHPKVAVPVAQILDLQFVRAAELIEVALGEQGSLDRWRYIAR